MPKWISTDLTIALACLVLLSGCARERPVELPAKPTDKPLAKSPETATAETAAADDPPASDAAQPRGESAESTSETPADGATLETVESKPAADPMPDDKAAKAPKSAPEASAIAIADTEISANAAKTRIAKVWLTDSHKALCKVGVGDKMPPIELPNLDGQSTSLSSLYGPKASVIVFFDSRVAMSRMQLADLTPDVVEPYAGHGVRAIAIAVNQSSDQARQSLAEADAKVSTLVDTAGEGFAKVGSAKLPRTYVLDSTGTIVWFDIEYSRSTRRELLGAIRHLLASPEQRDASAVDGEPAAATASSPKTDAKPM